MGVGYSFASGFFKGMVDAKRQKAENARLLEEKRLENEEKTQGRVFEALLKGFNVTDSMLEDAGLGDFVGIQSSINKAEKYMPMGNIDGFLRPVLDAGDDMYEQGRKSLLSLDQQLENPAFFDHVVTQAKADTGTMNSLMAYLGRSELNYSNGYDERMGKAGVTGNERTVRDASGYVNLVRLRDALNMNTTEAQVAQEQVDNDSLNAAYMVAPGLTPVAFPIDVFNVDGDRVKKEYVHTFNKSEIESLDRIASKIGRSRKQVLELFSEQRDLPSFTDVNKNMYEGKTSEEIFYQQYGLFQTVMKMEAEGFLDGDILAGTPEKRNRLRSFILREFPTLNAQRQPDGGVDRYRAAVAMSFVVGTPTILQPPKNKSLMFGARETVPATTINGPKYLKEVMGYTDAQIIATRDHVKYSQDTLNLMDRLYTLETEDLKDTQGFSRWVKKTIIGLSIQTKQTFNVLGDLGLADVSGELSGNYKKNLDGTETTEDSIRDFLQAGGYVKDLSNITEAEAIQLTLAARMARAIDPSGRLSDQDFKIQLDRLRGAFITGNAESTRINLLVIASEFQKEIQRNLVLSRVANEGSSVTPALARTLEADRKIDLLLGTDMTLGTAKTPLGTAPTEGTTEAPTTGRGEPLDMSQAKNPKVLDTRVYIDEQGNRYPVTVYRDNKGTQYAYQAGGEYFSIDQKETTVLKTSSGE